MQKNLLATLADKNHVDSAKQLFSSVYWNAGWKGDYMLLAHDIPEKDLKWFRKKGILIKKCRPLSNEKIGRFPPVVLSKFYLFTDYFKKWKSVIYLDADILINASIERLAETKGFAACWDGQLKSQFPNPKKIADSSKIRVLNELYASYDLTKECFNTGVFSFCTDIISKDSMEEITGLVRKYGRIANTGDQAILNLFFYNRWIKKTTAYNCQIYRYLRKELKNQRKNCLIIHFAGSEKPWEESNHFYEKWIESLSKAEEINLKKRPKEKRRISCEQLREYEAAFRKIKKAIKQEESMPALYELINRCNKIAGRMGKLLNEFNPNLYYMLKNAKTKNISDNPYI